MPGPPLFHKRASLGSSYGEIGTIRPLGALVYARQAPRGVGLATISWHAHRTLRTLAPGGWSVFEDPHRNARCSEVFWRPALCREVLPLFGDVLSGEKILADAIEAFTCNIAIYLDALGQQHVLFSGEGRSLQLVINPSTERHTVWTTEVILPAHAITSRLRAVKRLNDLFIHHRLRPHLYPPHPRAIRLVQVLRALDASLDQASYREIGIALYGKTRVERAWNDPRQNLRDQIRRAVYRGRTLLAGAYRDLLR